MHSKPGSNMGAISGCFSSANKKRDKENKKPDKVKQVTKFFGDGELGCGLDEQIHLLSEKNLDLPNIDWSNLPSHLLPDAVVSEIDADDAPHIPANLFFWSDYHTDFDGTPDYKEIVHPKYDAILLKCATAPADWQVPDLRLPMASTYDFVDRLPSSGHFYVGAKAATSLPCIPTAFDPFGSSAGREGVGQPSDVGTSSTPYQSATDAEGGGVENYSFQRAYLQPVNISFQTATSVHWQRAARAEVRGSEALAEVTRVAEEATESLQMPDEPTPWKLPEDEVKALRERSQRYLKQFDFTPTITRASSFRSVGPDVLGQDAPFRQRPTYRDERDGTTMVVRSHSALVGNSTGRKEKAGTNGKTTLTTTNPDIEYFKQQFAPILTTVRPTLSALDLSGQPWQSDGDEAEEDEGYYPELLEDPRPTR